VRAYLDDSGKSNDPAEWVLGVGGGIASVEHWEMLESRWRVALGDEDLTEFHGSKFSMRKDWDDARRTAFGLRLAGILLECRITPIGGVIPLESYRSLTEDQQRDLKDAFFVCFQSCLQNIALFTVGAAPDEFAHVFLAKTPQFSGLASNLYSVFQSEHLLGHKLGPFVSNVYPSQVLPLQVADLIAYTMTKWMKTALDPRDHWARTTFEAIKEIDDRGIEWIPLSRLREGLGC
jgi:hypothetical protein